MSPRLRPKRAVWSATAIGRLTRLARVGDRQIAATIALDLAETTGRALAARIAEWEALALHEARRRKRRGAHELHAAARRLRLRPSLFPARPELRLVGAFAAVEAVLAETREEAQGESVQAAFSAGPVILPAAGIVALEFRLTRLSTHSHP